MTLATDSFVAPEVTADTMLTFQLTASDGTAMGPDGDALTYVWTQTSGPTVTLAAGATQAFAAPAGQLGFSVTASDGTATSEPATVSVHVVPKPPEGKKGCGCATAEGLLGLAGLLVMRRRRRS